MPDGIRQLHVRSMGWNEWAWLCLCAVLWGSAYVFNAVALKELPPLTITLARLLVASLFMQIVLRIAGLSLSRDWRVWATFFALSVVNNIGPYLLVLRGQMGASSGLAAVLAATTPLFTIILAHFLTRDERMSANKLVGVVVGIAGVAIVVGFNFQNGVSGELEAKLILVLASVLYAIGGIFAKRIGGMPPLVIAATIMTTGMIEVLPLALIFDRPWTLPVPSLQAIGAVGMIGVFGSALAAVTYFRVFTVSGATNAMLVTLLLPVTPVIAGAILLGERLSLREFLGAAVIMLSLVIIDGRLLPRLLDR